MRVFLALFLFCSVCQAREIAFKCDWDSGDIIFAENLEKKHESLKKTFEIDGVTYRVSLPLISPHSGTVELIENSKITIKPITCISTFDME